MNTEKNILLEIDTTILLFLNNINDMKKKFNEIKLSVKKLDNNYFYQDQKNVYNQLLDIFEGPSIQNLTHRLTKCKHSVDHNIKIICQHDWVHDLIDITPDKSQQICYCKNCEVTKK